MSWSGLHKPERWSTIYHPLCLKHVMEEGALLEFQVAHCSFKNGRCESIMYM